MPPSAPADLTPAFITATSAFATAIVVAAIVAPWIQARARRNDRWERAVSELSALVDVEIEHAIDQFASAVKSETAVRLQVLDRGLDPQNSDVRAWVDGYENTRRIAEAALGDLPAGVAKQVGLVRPRLGREDRNKLAQLAQGLELGVFALITKSWGLGLAGHQLLDETFNEVGAAVGIAHTGREALARYIEPMALSMKPPRPVRRLIARWLERRLGWLRWPYSRVHAWASKRLDSP